MHIVFSIVKKNNLNYIYMSTNNKNDLIKTQDLDPEANISPASAMSQVYENTNLDFTKKIIESDIWQNPAIIFIIVGVFLAFMILFNTLGVTFNLLLNLKRVQIKY